MGASLKDVAALAGVSVRTASNVANDFKYVAPATRARVQRALDELQYRPNLAARNLRRGRSGVLGLLVPEIASPYFSELAALLTEAAEQRGWTLSIDQTTGDADRERRLLDGGAAQAVDGLIVSPWALSPAEIAQRGDVVPLVLLGERGAGGEVDYVGVDNVAAAVAATGHLIERGRRRIAAIGLQPHLSNDTARQRLEGYRRALAAADMTADPALEVAVQALHRSDGAEALQQLLSLDDPPDGVFCFNDQLALGALRAAHDAGLRVPADLAVIGFDDIEDGAYSIPSLTTVAPDKRQIAEQAIDCLAERLAGSPGGGGRQRAARSVITGHRLLVRESTGS